MKGKNPEEEGAAPEAAPAASGESFGAWLRRQREGRQIALREIADASKISLRYLQALEADRFEVLPAAVFAKGFLRQYARYVGLDPEEVINFYLAARQAAEVEEEDEAQRQPVGGSGALGGWKIVLAILVLLGVVALLFHLAERRNTSSGAPASPAPVEAGPSASTSRTGSAGGGAESAAPGLSAPGPATPGPSAPAPATSSTAAPAPPASEPTTADRTSGDAPIRVTIDFTGECWVQARVDGRRALSETRIQGESLHLEAERAVELTFGDGGAVTVEVNGQTYPLETQPGRVERLVVDLAAVAAMGTAGTR